MTEEELDEALAAHEVPEPPEGFADRVMAAAQPEPSLDDAPPPRVRRSLARWTIAGAAGIAAAAAVVLWPAPPTTGALEATARTEAQLGERGVAVAEPGAALRWTVDGRTAEVDQTTGDVFYRAEPSERFAVHTPAGDVVVHGTCFRVEVLDMNVSPQLFVGAAAGALIAGSVMVTVYEGEVGVENDHGAVSLAAGERTVMRPDAPPTRPAEPAPPAATDAPASARAAALSDEELAEMDAEALRARIRALTAEDREADHEIARLRGLLEDTSGESGRVTEFFPASPSQLRQWAEDCQLRVDQPPVMRLEPGQVGEHAETLGLSDAEVEVVQAAIDEMHVSLTEDLRALYIEATGDVSGAAHLSPNAMFAEIRDVAAPGEGPGVIMNRIARERAGLATSPLAGIEQSATERAIRLYAGTGDDFQRRLAQALGPERAYELRAADNGWPWSHSVFTGCPDGD